MRHTVELDRIRALLMRRLDESTAMAHVGPLTRAFAKPGATPILRPWRAMCLAELMTVRGLFAGLPVGFGKTLITHAAPIALGSRCPVMVLAPALHEKTWHEFEQLDRDGWRSPSTPIRLLSPSELALEKNQRLLDEIDPDLIIIDECDDLANSDGSVVKRIDRCIRRRTAAGLPTSVVACTGTPSRKSIMGYWHHLCWCLGDGAPVPLVEAEARQWACALDDRPWASVAPGALGSTRAAARRWYFDRLATTPGVVIVDGDSCDQPLTIRYRIARESAAIDKAFERFAVLQENPGEIPVSDPLSRWLQDALLGQGLYTIWRPPPPLPWRESRRAVAGFVRQRIDDTKRARQPLDTERQVLRHHADHPVVQDWARVEPTFDGATEMVWFDDATLASAEDWLRELDGEAGIVWCGSVDFGRKLAQRTGLRYYGAQGKADDGSHLFRAPEGRSLIASWQANKKGLNLQAWHRALIVMPPQSAKWLEQIIGREHRSGQRSPVIVDVLMTSGGTLDAFEAACQEARFARETVGMTQKILRAQIVRAEPTITEANRFRWARKGDHDRNRTERETRNGAVRSPATKSKRANAVSARAAFERLGRLSHAQG